VTFTTLLEIMATSTASNSNVVPFRLDKPRYDQSNFSGRFRHFLDVIDPRTLFTSSAKLQESLKLLEQFKTNTLPPGVTDEDLWAAKKIKDAIIHPDTGEIVPMPFRMSGFVPFGTPVVVGMLLPNQTLLTSIFWQWLNQTHNALVNYYNRNASVPQPTSLYVTGYFGAVASAVTVAGGLGEFISRTKKIAPATKAVVQKFIPYPAVATANTCNIFLMRRSELSSGISIMGDKGQHLGNSTEAAKKALMETALTRIILPAPILVLPPIIMGFIEKTVLFKRYPRTRLPVHATVVTAAFGLALPLAISLFPQNGTIDVDKLEPTFAGANWLDKNGNKLKHVVYNKGL